VRAVILFLVSILMLGAVAPAAAQDAAAAPAADAPAPAEQAKALADALKDETLRNALIEELERLSAVEPDVAGEAAAPPPPRTFGRIVAETTRDAVEGVVAGAAAFWERIEAAPRMFSGLSGNEASVLWKALLELAATIAVTVATFFVLRALAKRLDRRIGARAAESDLVRTVFYVIGSLIIDMLVVAAAWATGYAVAVIFFGEFGSIGIRQALYLNAFLAVELVKVGVRTVLSPTTGALRPIDLPDRGARRLNIWVSVVVSVLGYGQLLVVPIVNQQIGWLAGQSMVVLVSILAVLLLVAMTLVHRRQVAEWLLNERNMMSGSGTARFLARNWYWPILLYLLVLLVIVITRPGAVLLPVLGASAQILGGIVLGSIAANAISRSIRNGLHLPANVNQRVPLLERRLNAFVPRVLYVVRALILFAVFAFAMHVIGAIDLWAWLEGEVGAAATGTIASVGFILLGSFAVWLALSSWIDYRLNPDFGTVPSARERTLLSLARNAGALVVIAITLMFALSELGIDIAPLIASAGVIGLAIGFGAQKLVQDIITGVFIQFENAMNVGDVVQVGGTTGTVERLTIRSVSLRDVHGVFHIIPFSSVDLVSNYMRGFGHYVVDMGIAYRENTEDAKAAMFDAFEELRGDDAFKNDILEDFNWMGLHAFGDSAVVLRARIKCAPGKQWGVGRAYNAIVKRIFDERGIDIPFPHQTIYFGEDKDGKAPVAHVRVEDAEPKPEAAGAPGEEKPA